MGVNPMSIFIPLRGHSKALVIPSDAQRSCGILLPTMSCGMQSPLRNRHPLLCPRVCGDPVKRRFEKHSTNPLSSRMRGPIPFSPFVSSFPRRTCPREDPLYVFPRRREPIPHPSVIPAKAGIQGWGIVPPITKTLAASPPPTFALQGEK